MSSEAPYEQSLDLMLQGIGSLGMRIDRLINTIQSPLPGQTGSIWPRLVEDIILMIIDKIAPPLNSRAFFSEQTRDGKTLKCLRLVNSYFAGLITPRLFNNISIGRTTSSADIPPGILQHLRFLSLYANAFTIPTSLWLKIRPVKLLGIHCEADARTPFWPFIKMHLLPFHSQITQLSVRFSLLSFSGSNLAEFENAITILAKTVKSVALDMHSTDFNGLSALKAIKRNFTELTSMEILRLDAFSGPWVFTEDWVCSPMLQILRLSNAFISFPDELSQFIRYMRSVIRLEVEDCRPFFCTLAKPNNSNVLYIERHRKLELVDKGTFFFGRQKNKTLIELALVEVDAFIDP